MVDKRAGRLPYRSFVDSVIPGNLPKNEFANIISYLFFEGECEMKINPETLFSATNMLAMAGWLLLIFMPRWRWTSRLVISGVIPMMLATVYLVLIVTTFGRSEGGFGSLAGVAQLFQNHWVLLAGWVHYLAFDLFVGSWEVKDAQQLSIPHLLVVPCLALTFFLGPIGFLAYMLVSFKYRRAER